MTKVQMKCYIDSFLKEILNSQENSIILVWEAEEILKLIEEQRQELEKKNKEIYDLKRVLELGLNKEKQYCFNEDGHTRKCLGYGDDEPCNYCKSCKRININ